MLLFLLPLLIGAANAQFERTNIPCDQFSAVLLLRCVSPLIEYTKQYGTIIGPVPDPHLICSFYDDYTKCAPIRIRERCKHFVQSIDAVYDYVCSDDVKSNFTATYACLTLEERVPHVVECGTNATHSLRDIALADDQNKTDTERMDMECDAITGYLDCVKDNFRGNCGEDGWSVKREVTLRSTSAGVANCSYSEYVDLTIPVCEKNTGFCTCQRGLTFNPKTTRCDDIDECNEFGLCSQECINTIGGYECTCDSRYYKHSPDDINKCIRLDDNSSSSYDPVSILFAHGQSIWNISHNGETFQLIRAGLQKAAMIDIDIIERRLYYVDIGANSIQRMRFEGAFPQKIVKFDVEGTEGIAVDWIGRNMYTVQNTDMYVYKLDGTYKKMVYSKVFKLPRALVVYPQKGYLFASDWGQQPFIARFAMDGTMFEKLVTTGLVWPNGLTIDYYANKLYWADAFLDIIQCSNFDGTNRQVVLQDSASVPHVFSMAVLDDSVYWTDWTYRGIVRANKFNGGNVTVVAQAALLPYGIKMVHQVVQPAGPDPCKSLKCGQLCLLTPQNDTEQNAICACADGFKMKKSGCQFDCDDSKQLMCMGNNPKCISKIFRCDGIKHCSDNSDEKECPQRICLQGQFQCHDGDGCIVPSKLCDGTAECNDRSDEQFCEV